MCCAEVECAAEDDSVCIFKLHVTVYEDWNVGSRVNLHCGSLLMVVLEQEMAALSGALDHT